MEDLSGKVVMVTGAAHRVGAAIARRLHAAGMNLIIHYRHSAEAAAQLQDRLNAQRPGSATLLQADLHDSAAFKGLLAHVHGEWGRLDALVNNASSFYPTPVGSVDEDDWEDLVGSNLKAPFFLTQAAAPYLSEQGGSVVNIVDIHAERPLKDHPVYSIAKAGLVMLTRSLARELGPDIRVNAVAPGAILWPEQHMSPEVKAQIIDRTALKRQGDPADVAGAVHYLIADAPYMTGQVLTVDGGRSLSN